MSWPAHIPRPAIPQIPPVEFGITADFEVNADGQIKLAVGEVLGVYDYAKREWTYGDHPETARMQPIVDERWEALQTVIRAMNAPYPPEHLEVPPIAMPGDVDGPVILTVGELVDVLLKLDRGLHVVLDDGESWYHNVDLIGVPTKDGMGDWACLTLGRGSQFDTRQF